MKCILCGSSDLQTVDTIVSDFVMARINENYTGGGSENYRTKLCYCKDCTFAFYDYRMSDEEDEKRYRGYRDGEYQRLRERYECWYTKKVNDALNNDQTAIEEQKKTIEGMVAKNLDRDIEVALDYGGNEGKSFAPCLGTKGKYVYDISGIKTIDGVQGISDYAKLKEYSFDFIMSNMLFEHLVDPVDMLRRFKEIGNEKTVYYIEVPNENPFEHGNKFSIRKNFGLLFNPYYNNIRLIRYYFQQRKKPFMPMKEHINFFTKDSLKRMVERNGFRTLDVQVNERGGVLGNGNVLSILFVQQA